LIGAATHFPSVQVKLVQFPAGSQSEVVTHSGAPLDVLDPVTLVVGAPPPEVVAAVVSLAPPAELALVVVASPPTPEGESPASGSVQPWTRARAIVAAATIAGTTGEVRMRRA
jgi:hypothetical protein